MQAIQAVRYVLQPAVALDALMGEALGERRVEGGPADLVVWSGDPIDGSSRVLLVVVDGVILHEAEE
jgi:imidazolonepropionase-like amidohydrolase